VSEYAFIICFVLGLIAGAALVLIGLKYGFKASYEIRSNKEEPAEGKGLFPSKKDPAEFELIEENEPETALNRE